MGPISHVYMEKSNGLTTEPRGIPKSRECLTKQLSPRQTQKERVTKKWFDPACPMLFSLAERYWTTTYIRSDGLPYRRRRISHIGQRRRLYCDQKLYKEYQFLHEVRPFRYYVAVCRQTESLPWGYLNQNDHLSQSKLTLHDFWKVANFWDRTIICLTYWCL